jgi:hypothetical protein
VTPSVVPYVLNARRRAELERRGSGRIILREERDPNEGARAATVPHQL